MKPMKHGLSSFLRDATGGFSLGTLIAIASFVMLCRIVEKERHPDAWVVMPFTVLVLSYFAIDTVITRAVAASQKQVPDTQIQADTANVDSQQTTVSSPTGNQP